MTPGFRNVCTEQYIFNRIKRKFKIPDRDMNVLLSMYNNSANVTALDVYELFNFLDISFYSLYYRQQFNRRLLENAVFIIGELASELPQYKKYYPKTTNLSLEYLIDMVDLIFRLVNDVNFNRTVLVEFTQILQFDDITERGRRNVQLIIQFMENYPFIK